MHLLAGKVCTGAFAVLVLETEAAVIGDVGKHLRVTLG